jgi:ABC-type transport system involved in cytochrome bd biosynthesis fused ATPase/permease subunit
MPVPLAPVEQIEMDSLERQVEVNEWAYEDKLDTLFVLQLFFLALVSILILASLTKYGLMNLPFTVLVGLLLLGILISIWVFRAAYTSNVRDKQSWNRRRFQGDGSTVPAVSPEDVAAEAKKRIAYYEAAAAAGQSCAPL